MAINKRERNLLVITISMIVLGVNYFLISKLVENWQLTGSRLHLREKELHDDKAMIAKRPGLQSEYDQLGHNLTQAAKFEKISDVLKKIDEVANSAGILIQQRRPLKMEEHDVYREWPVQCGFEANTEGLVKFLHGLQSGNGFMTVEQLNVTPRPDNTSVLRCEIQIRALAARDGAAKS